MISQDPIPSLQANPDCLVLGFVCYLLAGFFFYSSLGRGRPRHRLRMIFDTGPRSLTVLRDAVLAKARGQAGATLIVTGSSFLLAGMLLPAPPLPYVQWGGAASLFLLAILFQALLAGHVRRSMRNAVKDHLSQHPFSFEDQISLTREIGDLFAVPSSREDTLEGYVAKVRHALGIKESPSRLFGKSSLRR